MVTFARDKVRHKHGVCKRVCRSLGGQIQTLDSLVRPPPEELDRILCDQAIASIWSADASIRLKNPLAIADFWDGISNTILAIEAKRDISWTKPEDTPSDPTSPLPAPSRPTEVVAQCRLGFPARRQARKPDLRHNPFCGLAWAGFGPTVSTSSLRTAAIAPW